MKNVLIIGGGPAALLLAAHLDENKFHVTICEKKKTVGRKFLVAGEGGLNLTYNSSIPALLNQYHPSGFMDAAIRQFTNQDLRDWLARHGINTFAGSSDRVFPDSDLKPFEVLNTITDFLSATKVKFQLATEWTGWDERGALRFRGSEVISADITVFAMGGASWKVTGSDGAWSRLFKERGVNVQPFRAANCAFAVDWSKQFMAAHAGKPLKNISLCHNDSTATGEVVITTFGLEGNALYALSQEVQTTLSFESTATVFLDLKPTMTVAQIRHKYGKARSSDVSKVLRNDLNLSRTSVALLKLFTDKRTFLDPELLAVTIKSVPIVLQSPGELDEAISTLGGIALDEVDGNFKLRKLPNSYAIGEMLDWFAPTGGYLLQGCFSMGVALANHLNELPTDTNP
ncbi:BaiN/RdsA family NAD(P)/FAD-dependent oxidoreductase [Neolewinella antarctica]|uniref:TIGR03862 family flavoprotein n=1 Tax=Neolewinella antarctica TaxID=442734 RepID=A0ABX0X6N1_9BACT|nr:TIGR03862 family flavoprotein [Neolewinella antarctica]NJC24527.1 hypothetical protein [Neolewinella antarctica]